MSDLGTRLDAEPREASGPKNIVVTYDGKSDPKIIEYLTLRRLSPDSLVFVGPDDLPFQPSPNTTLYLNHSPRFLGSDQKRKNWAEVPCFRFAWDGGGNILNTNHEKVKDTRD